MASVALSATVAAERVVTSREYVTGVLVDITHMPVKDLSGPVSSSVTITVSSVTSSACHRSLVAVPVSEVAPPTAVLHRWPDLTATT